MGKIRKKAINPLGENNRIVVTHKDKFWNLLEESIPNSQKTVWNCNYGWLVISEKQHATESCMRYQFSVWKPESLEMIKLPPLDLKPKQIIGAGTLLSPPEDPGSMILLFEDSFRYFICYKFGDKRWTKRWLGKEIVNIGHYEPFDGLNYFTHCDGKLYAATRAKGYLMMIQENRLTKNFKFTPVNCRFPTTSPSSCFVDTYLLDFCGQLCVLRILWGGVNHEHIIDIEASKLAKNGKKWIRMKSTEDKAIFISNKYAFCCSVNEPEIQGGHIYFIKNNRFYSVNIEDKSFSASLLLQKNSENSPFLSMRDLLRFCNWSHAKSMQRISKLETEEEEIVFEPQARSLVDLPFDMLELIAKYVYLVDYINFRSVCKALRLVAPQIKWREVSFKLQSQSSLSPWLVIPESTIYTFFDPHRTSKYCIKIPKCLIEGKILYSKDGWLLICNRNIMFFYQPFTKNLIELPQGFGNHYCCLGYSLSSSPASPDNILVGSSFYSIFCWRNGEWSEHQFADYSDFIPNHNSILYFDGAFYFLGRDGKLGVFGFNDGQAFWNFFKDIESPCHGFCYNYLLECGGELLSIFVVDQLVHIYKLNFTGFIAWEKVTSLGNHALFVSHTSSFSIIPNSPDMENKIYFRKLYGMDIVYYCLSTDKFYTCGNNKVLADLNNTAEFLFSTWIEPKWQI